MIRSPHGIMNLPFVGLCRLSHKAQSIWRPGSRSWRAGIVATRSLGTALWNPVLASFSAGLRLVPTSAGEFAQNELLGQTADDMQTHINPESFEYMSGSMSRTGVVSGRNGISN
jgi:hypothetical protein